MQPGDGSKAKAARGVAPPLPFYSHALWALTTISPVKQPDSVNHRQAGARGNLGDAANIASRHHIGIERGNIFDLPVAQGRGKLRLENVVGASRTAAQM